VIHLKFFNWRLVMTSKSRRSQPPGFVLPLLLLVILAMMGFGLFWALHRSTAPAEISPASTTETPVVSQNYLVGGKKVNHLLLGNPSKATSDPKTNGNNFLIERPEYVLSYSNAKHIPNWVSWQLNPSWLGTTPRQNNFRPDDTLPSTWYAVKANDYTGTGYDRGHMTPSADRNISVETESATYFMTNIVPQTPDNNRGPWEKLEAYGRSLVKQGKELYIVAGTYGNKGVIGRGNDKITVPESTWKIIVVMDKPGQRAKDINEKTRVIAIEIPNEQGIKETNWRDYRVSVDSIEAKTGYDFLSAVPKDVQDKIESVTDR
jgi:endonuclease G, mitochondrial